MDLIGQQIDQYLIRRHIARGGMADVYLAEDVKLRRKVALKVMLANLTHQRELIARFEREAAAVARLHHANIVQIYTAGLTRANQPYLAMQYVEGGSLHNYLALLAERRQQLAATDALRLARQMAAALDAAHRAGIIHRDLKPSNVLLHPDGTPVLTDLGIAVIQTEQTRLTQPDILLGTPHYMSPEQALGHRLDGRSDLYSLGVILYQMLARRVPFDGDSPVAILHQHVYEAPAPLQRVRPGLTEETYRVVARCLEKDPTRRFASAAHLVAALDDALAAESGAPRPRSWRPALGWRPTPDWLRVPAGLQPYLRYWWLALLVPLLMVLLVFGVYRLAQAVLADATGPVIPPAPTLVVQPGEPTPGDPTPGETGPTPLPAVVTADVTAVRLQTPITINGDLSDWPAITPVLSAHPVFVHPDRTSTDDADAAWRLAWDDQHLYVGVTVRDDIHVQTRTDTQVFRGDSLDMQIDTNPQARRTRLNPQAFQILLSPGDFGGVPAVVHRFRGNEEGNSITAPGHSITLAARPTTTGYVLEAAIPWRDLELTPQPGLVLGAALNVTDNDTPGTAVQELFKSNVPTRTFGDPTTWGTLTLE